MADQFHWVAGFAFTKCGNAVVMIRKNRPEWLAGCLNAVGGKIEPGEDAAAAMAREFREETGVATSPADWSFFAPVRFKRGICSFFTLFDDRVLEAETTTDETVELWDVDQVALNRHEFMDNIPMLMELARLKLTSVVNIDLRDVA